MLLKLTFLLCLGLFSLSGSLSAPEALFSANVTSAKVGQPIKLTCTLQNYTHEHIESYVNFYRDDPYSFFAFYTLEPLNSTETSTFIDSPKKDTDLRRQPLSMKYPVYEIVVTPTNASTHQFLCGLTSGDTPRKSFKSKTLKITVTH